MHSYERKSKAWMGFIAALVACFVAGCGSGDGKLFGGGVTSTSTSAVPGAPPGAIIPGAACLANAGPTVPTVTSSDPTNGNQFATTSTSGVAGGGKLITATFSLLMNGATITAATFTVTPLGGAALTPASVGYNVATRVATITTASALLANTTYTAVVSTAVTSATGVPLGCTYAWSFRTTAVASTGLAPVNLGLATPFAIASAAGVTNDLATNPPNTTINGDVVLDDLGGATANNGAICNAVNVDAAGGFGLCGGIAPAIVGTVISPSFPDAGITSGAIKADLNAAYLSITPANRPGAIVLGCGVIGTGSGAGAGVGCVANNNATIPPGVYISATASTIGVTGVLTLDGQGDLNSQFIFQAPSALTTAAGAPGAPGSQIILINGARASNVWWQVGSSAVIGTFAEFRGNVLADTSITMGDRSTSCGRLLAGAVTVTGAFTFDGSAVSLPGHANAPAGCQ